MDSALPGCGGFFSGLLSFEGRFDRKNRRLRALQIFVSGLKRIQNSYLRKFCPQTVLIVGTEGPSFS
ncbi:MAG TPA: hypothetical protein PKV71_00005, partial [Calditrichia bacterium]|nr:hypothetical protein [Calditrichia bacterium]